MGDRPCGHASAWSRGVEERSTDARTRQPSLRSSAGRSLGLAGALLLPALAAPARAAEDKLVLRVGTVQDLDSTNPYQTLLVVGYEVFQLTYNLLVDFGPDLEPVPGFADELGARRRRQVVDVQYPRRA